MYDIWLIEESGKRMLVRENVDLDLARALVNTANHGADLRGEAHSYVAEPTSTDN